MDKYMILNDVLVKNPAKDDIDKCPVEKRITLKPGKLENVVCENWWVDIENGTSIDFSYDIQLDNVTRDGKRTNFFLEHGVEPKYLKALIIPSSLFSEEGVKIP